jgi:primosomal protein N' (replication factor Y)
MHCFVAVPSILDKPLTYEWDLSVKPVIGQIVEVPLKNKPCFGVVWQASEQIKQGIKVKNVISTSSFCLNESYVSFLQKFCDYTLTSLGVLIKHVLPKATKAMEVKNCDYNYQAPVLTNDQKKARDSICNKSDFNVFVLEGVTGSGKTEVYLDSAMHFYNLGKQVLILLPEIALTSQFQERFTNRLGKKPLIWHSQITPKQRETIWQTVLSGEPCVLIGARSSLLLPFSKLGLIVVDEEHDHSYKQEEVFLYNARDMAVLRAREENIPIILASATPSLETIHNVQAKRYQHLLITERFGKAKLPNIEIISLKGLKKEDLPNPWIHPILLKEIRNNLGKQEQTLLFLNRRGYAPLTICGECGLKMMCPACDVALVQHKTQPRLHCHYCNFTESIPKNCPKCNSENMYPCGPGVERLSDDLQKLLGDVRLLKVTSDLVNTPKRTQEMVELIQSNQTDIIIATQMLTKGYHFPNITLVGVIDADMRLNGPNLRCAENTYQQLHQVAGRCGREEKTGKVYLQTYDPTHPVMEAVASWNKQKFIELELEDRRIHGMPPYGKLTSILISGRDNLELLSFCRKMLNIAPVHEHLHIMGPVPAPLARLKNHFRWRFLLKYSKGFAVQNFIKIWLKNINIPSNIRVVVDIDPLSFH